MVQIMRILTSRTSTSCKENRRLRRATIFDEDLVLRAATILTSRAYVPLSVNGQFRFATVSDKHLAV